MVWDQLISTLSLATLISEVLQYVRKSINRSSCFWRESETRRSHTSGSIFSSLILDKLSTRKNSWTLRRGVRYSCLIFIEMKVTKNSTSPILQSIYLWTERYFHKIPEIYLPINEPTLTEAWDIFFKNSINNAQTHIV
jgi:hypothetical protein